MGFFFFLRNGTGSAKSSHLTGNHTEGRRFAEIQYSLPAEVVLGGNPPAGGCFGRRGIPRRVPSILSIPTGYRNREILNTVLWGVTAFSKRVSLDVRDNNASRELVPPPGGVKPTAHYMTLHMIVYTFLIPWWWCPCMIGIIYIHFFFSGGSMRWNVKWFALGFFLTVFHHPPPPLILSKSKSLGIQPSYHSCSF